MRSHAPLGAILLLTACASPPPPQRPPAAEAPEEPQTWLGQVARADLPQASQMAVPVYAKTQAVAGWLRESARIEAGVAALPILRQHPGAVAWSPRAWRMIALLHAQNAEAGADLAAQAAEAMAGLAALRAAAPGADEDRVAGNRWHLPAAAALAAARPRMSEAARRWTDALPADGVPMILPPAVERMRQADALENDQRQRTLLLAISGVAPPPALATSSPAGTTPTPAAPLAQNPAAAVPAPPVAPAQMPAPRPAIPAAIPGSAAPSPAAPPPRSPTPSAVPAGPAARAETAVPQTERSAAPSPRPTSAPADEPAGDRRAENPLSRRLDGRSIGGLTGETPISRPQPRPWDLPWTEQVLSPTPMSVPMNRPGDLP